MTERSRDERMEEDVHRAMLQHLGADMQASDELCYAIYRAGMLRAAEICEALGPRDYPITGALYDRNCAAAIRDEAK